MTDPTDSDEKKLVLQNGPPHYVASKGNGEFYVVESVIYKKNSIYKLDQIITDKNIGTLILGLNLREIPNRHLSLLVRVPTNTRPLSCHVHEARKLAELTGCEYFCFEILGSTIDRTISTESNSELREICPRLFRKIVDN